MESVDGIAVENACSFSDSRVGLDHTQLSRSTASFNDRGFARIECLITDGEVAELIESYMQLVDSTTEEVAKHRYDLGEGDTSPKKVAMEKITQIMWPSDILPALRDHAVRSRGLALARALHCDDSFVFDFDMLIAKAPHTDTPTPAHQDQAYWPLLKVCCFFFINDFPFAAFATRTLASFPFNCGRPVLQDKRAVSIWVALDESTIDNGCMWYGPGTHKLPLRPHRKSGPTPNAALECDASEAEMEPMPLKPGWAGAHAGGTLHYSRGNSTDGWRRAYIM